MLRHIVRRGRVHHILDAILDNIFSEDFECIPQWPRLTRLSNPACVLDAQLRVCNTFLQLTENIPFSAGQQKLIALGPHLTGYLRSKCACGCGMRLMANPKACTGCRRAYYASKECQSRYVTTLEAILSLPLIVISSDWPLHRDICKGVWQKIRSLCGRQ